MDIWQEFHGPNAGYILELYERYLENPEAVDPATRAAFARWQPDLRAIPTGDGAAQESVASTAAPTAAAAVIIGAVNLANAIREYGHLAAEIDPLGLYTPPGDPALEPAAHGVTRDDLRALPADVIGGPLAREAGNALEAIQALRAVYAAAIGYDYDHIRVPEEREWLREAAESRRFRPPHTPSNPRTLLERLTQVEAFEQFLHRVFPGKTRFSIEGLDMMVPMLEIMLGEAAESGIYTILIGMAHRGRLNVLAHVLHKPYEELLMEFRDTVEGGYATREYLGWSGDVKYHAGATRAMVNHAEMVDLVVKMAPNPSHLEHVNPVVAGMARAAGTQTDRRGPATFNPQVTLPIVIHGDAAFPAQGVVAETLNLQRLRGYSVGGTIHIIANNQVGFTTTKWYGRSTLYASDLAKGYKIPIVHVNADDPEACIEAARLAFAYRQTFKTDFVIDLVGYRRYGHNEGDEPRFTQPRMYTLIDKHPTVRARWAAALEKRGVITRAWADELLEQQIARLQAIYQALPQRPAATLEPQLEPPPAGAAKRVETAVPLDHLRAYHQALLQWPDDFRPNEKLARALRRQRDAFDDPDAPGLDWAGAERLAFASILAEGTAIRLTGEDVERGTFSHRHAVMRDREDARPYIPLHHLPQAAAAFEVRNSPLSENAALGFEYGYNIEAPDRLVIWEAQYGDFINSAQAIVDEFVVSGKSKWEQTPSLALLLPHGYEGQGPDHSTARLERFLQLAAETNVRIAYPTTAAQYFHLLRRQALLLKTDPLPLIVMAPKSLLRHPVAASAPHELAEGRWQSVLDDGERAQTPEAVTRLILCSGKVYVDLVTSAQRARQTAVALVRVEQLYPLPGEEIGEVIAGYPNLTEVVWLQEEPENGGAWEFARPRLEKLLNGRYPLRFIGRPRRASPAEGSSASHKRNQATIVERAYEFSDE
jgi:2-oxoglutarate dehydrogenase E1 component